jgi:hypothetical protein
LHANSYQVVSVFSRSQAVGLPVARLNVSPLRAVVRRALRKLPACAALRADGSPRISGIECEFADGELRFGSMPGARKGTDLRRDPRFALHGPAFHPEEGKEAEWPGEAKIAGRAVLAGQIGEGPGGDLFLADISEVVVTRLNPEATLLVIESWTPQRGLRVVERE